MYRLLIADDEEDIRNGLADYFPWGEFGFRVTERVENGQVALDIIRRGAVDVVLTDIRMPMMSGIDLARIVFEEHLNVVVVFLSAYKDFSFAQQAIQYGVRRYILKPTDYSEIGVVFTRIKRELDSGSLLPGVAERSAPGARGSRSDSVVESIREYVCRDYAAATLSGAARLVHLNPQYVSRLFKATTGEHFNSFLLGVKMGKAAELLMDVGYCTYEVSEMVGYRNPKNFARSFKRHFGVSPRQFRQSSRDSRPDRAAQEDPD